jgi:ABC-type lipoprotein export system ATPase subunit
MMATTLQCGARSMRSDSAPVRRMVRTAHSATARRVGQADISSDSRWRAAGWLRAAAAMGCDEPISHLDKASLHAVLRDLLVAHPDACVLVTLHDPAPACQIDDPILLSDGRIVKPAPAA